MANKNTIGCSAGRARIVDPNDFDGFESSSNVPVQLEDLNISVILTSFRKGRTLLTGEAEGGVKENVSQISVNFIEGIDLGGKKKVLTTSYTDLTTRFDTDVINDETLGITNIDIEFNSSFAPMITINFIDVRGSSIFQNEENILNNRGNKYTTFFQIPYPMYELEVKGYYGMPVKYCLHMLKFNSRFNSQTGNFEITANFIGYTFAMMSDMLLGYLKAIPFTSIGKEQFENYNSSRTGDPVLQLSELSKKISLLNEGIKKETNENPASKEINAAEQATDNLDSIKTEIHDLGVSFDLNQEKDEFKYIVFKHIDTYSDIQSNNLKNGYMVNVKEAITSYNTVNPSQPLNENEFLDIEVPTNKEGGKKYSKITIKQLKSDADPDLTISLGNPDNESKLKQDLVTYINTYYATTKIGDDELLDIFDMTLLYDKLGKAKKSVEILEKESKTKLAKAFEGEVRTILGFDPTARTIIECFTAAIETFIETIYRVSSEASINTERTDELAKKFKDDDEAVKITDMKNVFIQKQQFFPWPDYRERNDEQNTYVDKYLGADGVLEQPLRVNELVFIDDLLVAFRKAKKAEDEAIENEEKSETTWMSLSPIDSVMFNEFAPYERDDLLSTTDIVKLMLIRGMMFLGYSNDLRAVSDIEIKAMGIAEVNNMIRSVKDDVLRQAMTKVTKEFITNVAGEINGSSRKVIESASDLYYYDFIYNDNGINGWKILPVNKGFGNPKKKDENNWGFPTATNTKDIAKTLSDKAKNEGYLFLTNYSDAPTGTKPDDGGVNMLIMDTLPEPIAIEGIPEGVPTETKMILAKLIGDPDHPDAVPKDAGYNSFNASHGIQEYETMDWGNKDLEGLPLMYVFYRDCDTGLALDKKASGKIFGKKELKSSYAFSKGNNVLSKVEYPSSKEDVFYAKQTIEGFFYDTSIATHYNLGQNRLLFNAIKSGGKKDSITYPYIELTYGTAESDFWGNTDEEPRLAYQANSFSLFGSELYYNQSYAEITTSKNKKVPCAEYSRAFLFLQTLPFNVSKATEVPGGNPFAKNEIRHLFDMKAGIIHAPKLWCVYIGSLLWRMDDSDPELDGGKIVGGGVGKWSDGFSSIKSGEPLVWHVDYTNGDINDWNAFYSQKIFKVPMNGAHTVNLIPYNAEYFPPVLDYTRDLGDGTIVTYTSIEDTDTLKTLPVQVKNEFKRMFFEFVNGSGANSWRSLADKLEIFDTKDKNSGKKFYDYLHKILDKADGGELYATDILDGIPDEILKVVKKYYDIVVPMEQNGVTDDFYLHLELSDNTAATDNIINALMEEAFIINNNYKIWCNGLYTTERDGIKVPSDKYNIYFDGIIEALKAKTDEYNISKQNENLDIEIFGTANKDVIRLNLYRTCKNIYDKWLGGAKDINNLVFQCGNGTRSTVDVALAKKYGNSTTRMIDSFRFVNRSFKDIGDSLYINPIPINDYLIGNANSSSYDAISSVLSSNHFNFQALPNFINFHDPNTLSAIFKPYNYNDAKIPPTSCGPAFICVYDGQGSKHLALPETNANYPNDGFDLRCVKGGVDVSLPTDFTSDLNEIDGEYYEEPVSTFMVRYSQQNQNIFKDIELDQSEFSETDESIQIQDEISQKGSENNRAIVGQNIYNVYAVRSYTAKVEMMGNAMIQPMMYFQLDNIPMFHGAYMITKVSHSIKPNNMSTNFTGTRIRYPETPLITAYEVYTDLIETLDLSKAGTSTVGGGGAPSYAAPLVQTLIENGASYSNIDIGNIKGLKVDEIPGIKFIQVSSRQLITEAVKPFTEMMKDWVAWMVEEGFKSIDKNGKDDVYAYVTSMFRTDGKASMHALGIAVDLQMYDKNGKQIPNHASNGGRYSEPWYFNFEKNPALKWLYNHSYEYGFVQPYWANDGKGSGNDSEEHWHWEYHGKSAICMLKAQLIPGKGDNKATDNPLSKIDAKNIKSFVKNPKSKDGKEADYGTGCKYKTVAASDKANGINASMDTVSTKAEIKAAQLTTKKFFKDKGLTKTQAAGAMGNIQKESGFNPKAVNVRDLNGYPSVGLIQWNGLYTPAGGSKDSNKVLDVIGRTVDAQLNYLADKWAPYTTWLNLGDDKGTKKYSNSAAYEFANIVEVCDQCNKGYSIYAASYQAERSNYAADFLNRFNDKSDLLYW